MSILNHTYAMPNMPDQRKVEEQLLMAETAIRASHSAIALADPGGKLTYVNPAFLRIWGLDKLEHVLGKSFADLCQEKEKAEAVFKALRDGGGTEAAELTAIRKNGTEFIVGLRASLIRTAEGNPTGVTISLADITQRKQFEEKQRELERMRTEFISNVSHELRTPLISLKGFTKLMLEGKVPDPETQKEFLTIMYNQSEHLQRLIESLLEVSRIDSGRFSIKKEPVQLEKVIRTAVESVGSLIAQKDMSIKEELPAAFPEIEGDQGRLLQVMVNLLSNAIKFSPEGSKITVKAENTGDELLVHVTDQGVGIPEEAQSRLFQRFYQVDSSTTRNVGGSGLGLYISKQIVEAHGGRIWVKSKEGSGSTFSFSIPTKA
ncbi:MAG: cell wall metabolism sensor histidine kinase WalK [Chloroflexi bacterium]|nr:cell wall metabolism sensor histidine kinase WalK [Chloroflexota bacterium]MBM3166056.1 cell wall metabolism sensor histidine kinase WalK [Chloroflexota bacterium]MBM3172996.1 cell wall metabolism sensor histidine kinase WalK [Chloroflexota bacterium]MBM4451592.1 cell wall metabolism sensor histidine kinase WalK [Chloroflexota bacterium]